MKLTELLSLPYNAGRIALIDRTLARLTHERGFAGKDRPDLDDKIAALMHKRNLYQNTSLVAIPVDFVCHTCQKRHRETVTPARLVDAFGDWYQKHPQPEHRVETYMARGRSVGRGFADEVWRHIGRAPWWLDYAPNTNILAAYGSSAAMTLTGTSLASSSTFIAGRESTVVDNTSNLYIDYVLAAITKVGSASVVAGVIQIWLHGSRNDAFAYGDLGNGTTLTGADAVANFITAGKRAGACNFWKDVSVDVTTANAVHSFSPRGIGASFDYVLPKKWGIWFVHNTSAALSSTAGDHVFSQTGMYFTG